MASVETERVASGVPIDHDEDERNALTHRITIDGRTLTLKEKQVNASLSHVQRAANGYEDMTRKRAEARDATSPVAPAPSVTPGQVSSRDLCAIAAMHALVSAGATPSAQGDAWSPDDIADNAFEIADAMFPVPPEEA